MERIFTWTRYFILVPIIGLILAATVYFIFGGIGLVELIVENLSAALGPGQVVHESDVPFAVETVEYVHQFLIGTVLYITALGFYQLFIKELDLPGWMKIENTDQLENSLIGVTVVVLAVHFMTTAFGGLSEDLQAQGIGTGLVIAALAVFLGLRSWGELQSRKAEETRHANHSPGEPDAG